MRAILIIIILCGFLKASSQIKHDIELWTGPKLEYEVTKGLRLDVEHQHRFNENISNIEQAFNEFSVRMRVARFFYIKPSYRFTYQDQPNGNNNRFTTDLYLKLDKKKFPLGFTYRLRYQRESLINKEVKQWGIRNRFGLDYNLSKRMDPSLSYELFWSREQFYRMRLRLGMQWRMSKRIDMETFYGWERQMNRKSNDISHIIGVIGVFNMKRKKK